jgi:hypothetical protein
MTLIHDKNLLKAANDMIAFESQVDEAIVFMNSILLNLESLRVSMMNDEEFSQDEIDEVQTASVNSRQKIKDYANSL